MSEDDLQALLRTGIQAARDGKKRVARRIFEQVLEIDDRNELAWMWMASVVETPQKRRICLENALAINPDNARARAALEKLGGSRPQGTSSRHARPKAQTPAPPRPAGLEEEPTEDEIDLDARLGLAPKPAHEPDWMAALSQPAGKAPPAEDEIDLDARLGGVTESAADWGASDWLDAPAPAAGAPRSRPAARTGTGPLPHAEPLPTGAPPRRRRRRRRILVLLVGGIAIIAIVTVAALLLRQRLGLGGIDILPGGTPAPPTAPPTQIVIVAPGEVTTVPTWTPSPTVTPRPTATPRPTRVPLRNYVLAYSALAGQERQESIYTVWADGDSDTLTQLTTGDTRDLYPALSPMGDLIAFVSERTGNPELFVMDANGGEPRQLTALGAARLESPSWSPDGARIVFSADASGNDELYVVSLESGAVVKLTDNPSTDREPAWSPDGKTIAFASDRTGRGYLQIFTLPAGCDTLQGGCEVYVFQITRSQNSSMSPAWSPDSRYIAFVSNRVSIDDNDIYVMRDDGTDPRLLTLDQYGDNGASDLDPSWSRDGQWIAFASDREGTGFQIYVMAADGTDIHQVTSVSGSALHPSWFP
ncbi:MAG: hypothetical protein Kow00120_02140 [Anaerolineae bacterium]